MASQDLTILLPLKGRDDFSVRWFTYAAKHALPYKVLVADGGHDEGLQERLRRDGIFDKIDCDYVRYPFDSSIEMFFKKMADALTRVQTPYVVIANNDDFIFFEALDASVAFLNQHPDFACSRGEIWDFMVTARSPRAPIYGEMTGIRKIYFHPTVTGDSAMARVADLVVKFHLTGHEIVRTPVLSDAYARIVNAGLHDIRFADKCSSFMIAAAGKMHRGDHLYMLHQSHGDMSAVTHFKRPSRWIAGQHWDRDLDLFADCLASAISEIDHVEFYKAKSEVLRIATRHFLDLVVSDLAGGEPRPPHRVRQALVEGAKWLVRRHRLLENLAHDIWSTAGNRQSPEGALPAPLAGKLADIEAFMKTAVLPAAGRA